MLSADPNTAGGEGQESVCSVEDLELLAEYKRAGRERVEILNALAAHHVERGSCPRATAFSRAARAAGSESAVARRRAEERHSTRQAMQWACWPQASSKIWPGMSPKST